MFVVIAIFSVLLCSSQGNEVNPEKKEAEVYMNQHKKFIGDMKGWLLEMNAKMKAQVEETTKNFLELPNSLVENGKAQLALHYAYSTQEVMGSSAHEHCIANAQQQLEQLHANNLNSFITCKNLTTGIDDILHMGLEISKLTADILLTADEVLNGFSDCQTWNVFKFFYCTFNWVKNSITDIYRSFEAVSDFADNMAVLISDLKNQYEYCMHGSKATALLHHVQVLNGVLQCVANSR